MKIRDSRAGVDRDRRPRRNEAVKRGEQTGPGVGCAVPVVGDEQAAAALERLGELGKDLPLEGHGQPAVGPASIDPDDLLAPGVDSSGENPTLRRCRV